MEKLYYHSYVSLHKLEKFSNERLMRFFPETDVEAIRARLVIQRIMGHQYVTFGPCDDFGPDGKCRGHSKMPPRHANSTGELTPYGRPFLIPQLVPAGLGTVAFTGVLLDRK